jgi:hypothetical protein
LRHTSLDWDGFVDSIGAVIPGDTLELGSFTYGVRAGTTLPGDGANIRAVRPFAEINGIWNYQRESDFIIALTGAKFANPENGVSLGGGVEVAFNNGTALRAAGNWFAYDTELEGWSVSGGIGAPLAAFGIGNPASAALVSLDFTGSGEGAGAMARLRIPLN